MKKLLLMTIMFCSIHQMNGMKNEQKKALTEELASLKENLSYNGCKGILNYFRDILIKIPVVGKDMLATKRAKQARFRNLVIDEVVSDHTHQSRELQESLKNVNECLKKNPDNKTLIAQKELVTREITSFSALKNHDSFYRSSMKRSDFNLFKQCDAVVLGRE